jgi:hypothetical protein
LRGEVVIHVLLEVLGQESRHHASDIGRVKALAFELDILAVEQGGDNRGIGRRAADAVFFERLDQRRLAVAWRRFGEMLFQPDFVEIDDVAFLQRRQQVLLAVVLLFGLVPVLYVNPHETRIANGRAVSAETVAGPAGQVDRNRVQCRVDHLAGHGALPDQAV